MSLKSTHDSEEMKQYQEIKQARTTVKLRGKDLKSHIHVEEKYVLAEFRNIEI